MAKVTTVYEATDGTKFTNKKRWNAYETAYQKLVRQIVLSDHQYYNGIHFTDATDLLAFIVKFNQKG